MYKHFMVNVHIHKTHRRYTGGSEVVAVQGDTVGKCIDDLLRRYPGMREVLFDSRGALRSTIEIYVNLESAYPDELRKPVRDGDEIHLTLLLAGG
ncbi:MAG: MoaD/ThiS family protein [Desulfatiglandaceae bacterium]